MNGRKGGLLTPRPHHMSGRISGASVRGEHAVYEDVLDASGPIESDVKLPAISLFEKPRTTIPAPRFPDREFFPNRFSAPDAKKLTSCRDFAAHRDHHRWTSPNRLTLFGAVRFNKCRWPLPASRLKTRSGLRTNHENCAEGVRFKQRHAFDADIWEAGCPSE